MSYSYKDIINIAWPLMIGNLAYTLISFSDMAFMGRVGIVEQGAIGYVGLLYLILFMIGYAYTKGTQILVARNHGANDEKSIGTVVDNSIFFLIALAFLLFFLICFFGDWFIYTIIDSQEIADASIQYLNVRIYGFFLSFTGSILVAYYTGIGRTKTLAVAIVLMSVSNIFLNWVLIFGKLGFPKLGIIGAAWASNIAEGISLLILIAGTFFFRLRGRHKLFYFRRIDTNCLYEIGRLAFPLMLQTLIGLAAWFTFFTLIENKLGKVSLAVSNVVKILYTTLGIPTFALANTANTVISNVIGRKKIHEVIPMLKRILLTSFCFAVLFALPAFLFPKLFIQVVAEPNIVNDSVRPMLVALVALVIYSQSTVLFNAIVSIGSTNVSLVIEIIAICIYLLYLYIIYNFLTPGLINTWISEWIYWLGIALFSILYLKYAPWREKLKKQI